MTQATFVENAHNILGQVRKAVVGKDNELLWVLAAVLAGGHILLEDIPGVGKTTMALAFSKALDLQSNRIQFTPDVLPSDVTGYTILDPAGNPQYRPGAALCNLLLADELNRATSRTQAALLEAMEEGAVTVDGVRHVLPEPFVVMATQNPTGAAGTQLLPDSQMDRFAVRLTLGYPDPKAEIRMAKERQGVDPLSQVERVVTAPQLLQMRALVAETYISDELIAYVVEMVNATRGHEELLRGASPRATLAVIAMAKAAARLGGRDYVVPQDIRQVWVAAVAHRLVLRQSAKGSDVTAEAVLEQILDRIPAPKLR